MKTFNLKTIDKKEISNLKPSDLIMLTMFERDAIELLKHFLTEDQEEVKLTDFDYDHLKSALDKIKKTKEDMAVGDLVKIPGHDSWFIRNVKTGKIEGRIQFVDDKVPE